MRTWHSIRLCCLHATLAAATIGCGSDFGGLLGYDSGNPLTPDSGNGIRPDGAAQPDANGGSDSSAITPDGNAVPDSTSTPDVSVTPDATVPDTTTPPADTSTPGDAPGRADAGDVRPSDATLTDRRPDSLVSADATTDTADARVDVSTDTGAGSDASEAGADRVVGATCGDGHKDPGEQCDDGNKLDFDGCSSICTDRRACICCAIDNGGAPACKDVTGEASGGPQIGATKAQLCQDVYGCFLKTKCGQTVGNVVECYCGAGNVSDVMSQTCVADPKGPCINEMEAAYEAEGTTWKERLLTIYNRFQDQTFGGGVAGVWWQAEQSSCGLDCGDPPVWSYCTNPDPPDAGDGGGSSDVADAVSED